ncbi:MAG: hypothetical protein Q4D38_13685 [Planctomycetia bacterium]|nr:hypothetical protein [Planctomycetia bacterium]
MRSNQELIAAVHFSPYRGNFVVAGGGSELISMLLCAPGASRTVLEACVPYSPSAMESYLNALPEHFCCEETARRLAACAWLRARRNTNPCPTELFGFSLTATLASLRPHRGEHRAFAAFQTQNRTVSYALQLTKGENDRAAEEKIVARWALRLLADACGVEESGEKPIHDCRPSEGLRRVFVGEIPFVLFYRDLTTGEMTQSETLPSEPIAIFPGSFHPFHEGHAQMWALAERTLGRRVALELAILNADKPPLDFAEIEMRLRQIWASFPGNLIIVSGLPFFLMKAETFRNADFVVGIDTLRRMNDARYHHGSVELRDISHRRIAQTGAKFLVFGRKNGDTFETMDKIALSPALQEICVQMPECQFRNDISSTELRKRASERRS